MPQIEVEKILPGGQKIISIEEVDVQAEQHEPLIFATLMKRVQALMADTVVLIVLMYFASWVLEFADNPPEWLHKIIFVFIWFLYEPLFQVIGCTAGNYLMKIRVRKSVDYSRKINLGQAFLRYVFKVALGWLSFLTLGSTDRRQAIHDLVSKTVVIDLQLQARLQAV